MADQENTMTQHQTEHDEIVNLRAEVERLRERERHAIEYERRISWDVTCGRCADYLDASNREYIRAEKAEAETDALERQVEAMRSLARSLLAALTEHVDVDSGDCDDCLVEIEQARTALHAADPSRDG